MSWTDSVGLILIAVILFAIIRVMFRGPKSKEAKAAQKGKWPWGWLRDALDTTFVAGLLSSTAVGTWVINSGAGAGANWTAGIVCGTGVAILFALISMGGKWNEDGLFTKLLSFIFGAIGIIVTVASYFTPQGICTAPDIGQRVVGFLLVAAALILGRAMAWGRGLATLKPSMSLLAVFGALAVVDVLVAISNPLGTAVTGLGVNGITIGLVAAFALGFAASIWAAFTMGVAGLAVFAGSLYGAISGAGSLCTPGVTDASTMGPILAYIALYRIIKGLVGRFTGSKEKERDKESASA